MEPGVGRSFLFAAPASNDFSEPDRILCEGPRCFRGRGVIKLNRNDSLGKLNEKGKSNFFKSTHVKND